MKKTFFLLLPMMLLFQSSPSYAMDLSAAQAAVCMDAQTGRVILEQNAHMKLGMASTTKVMTGIIAVEHGELQEIVTVGKNAQGVEGTSIYLVEGEQQTMENLVYGLMLESGNDAAVAIAEHISGTCEQFAKLMNEKAQKIGAMNTNFVNPHGLYDPMHYTTAYDLALISAYAMKNDTFAKIAKAPNCAMPWPGHDGNKVFYNRNRLLNLYDGCDGVKPGYTPETGRTLVGSATKNNMRIITVTLNCRDDWNLHSRMLDYAFANYRLLAVVENNKNSGTIQIKGGNEYETALVTKGRVDICIKNGEKPNIEIEYDIPKYVWAPVASGRIVGYANVKADGNPIGSVPLLAQDKVDKEMNRNIVYKMVDFIKSIFAGRGINA